MALHLAAERGHIEVVRQLLDHVDLDDIVEYDNDSETALHKAAVAPSSNCCSRVTRTTRMSRPST
jgi:ankyrin repeat protein